jgi:hypothetical protein
LCIGHSTLHITPRVQAELGRDTPGHDVDDDCRGLVAVVAGEPEEVSEAGQAGRLAGVDPVRVDHDAGLLGLPEDFRQPHYRQRSRGQQVAQDLPGANRGQLIHVPG